MEIVIIAGYKFVALCEVEALQNSIRTLCTKLELKGTVLVSTEGININLAGIANAIFDFTKTLSEDKRFANISYKKSVSTCAPFRRLKVKIKREIIRMNTPGMCLDAARAPAVSPLELKRWLDEKFDILLLDTRNEFEVKAGSFRDALSLKLNSFGEFPQAAAHLAEETKEKTIVTFCTGGIRCEKATLYLQQQGYSNVYQLDGGILNYFEQCGSAHYEGECFVFDDRICLDHELRDTSEAFNTEPRSDNRAFVKDQASLCHHTNVKSQSR